VLQKILTWLALIVAVMWAVKNPHQVADVFHQALHALSALVSAL
jgi:hypothetical protein